MDKGARISKGPNQQRVSSRLLVIETDQKTNQSVSIHRILPLANCLLEEREVTDGLCSTGELHVRIQQKACDRGLCRYLLRALRLPSHPARTIAVPDNFARRQARIRKSSRNLMRWDVNDLHTRTAYETADSKKGHSNQDRPSCQAPSRAEIRHYVSQRLDGYRNLPLADFAALQSLTKRVVPFFRANVCGCHNSSLSLTPVNPNVQSPDFSCLYPQPVKSGGPPRRLSN
ncbi:hypothetical protein BaRGS_00010497 [Batillaria attramentaria]|uniref:Uncharacterized protein n=1 Tax=Batillaria attramentaria TaxID=370345 RepID=A0ABD0LGQ9_9CAEN